MLTYVARRVLYSIPVLLVSSFLSFTFVSLAGDPLANLRQNPRVSQLTLHLLVHKYHLDASVPVRYWYWLQDVFAHKLGTSLITSQPIWPDIQRTIGHTAQILFNLMPTSLTGNPGANNFLMLRCRKRIVPHTAST